jgi:hypothetical protein
MSCEPDEPDVPILQTLWNIRCLGWDSLRRLSSRGEHLLSSTLNLLLNLRDAGDFRTTSHFIRPLCSAAPTGSDSILQSTLGFYGNWPVRCPYASDMLTQQPPIWVEGNIPFRDWLKEPLANGRNQSSSRPVLVKAKAAPARPRRRSGGSYMSTPHCLSPPKSRYRTRGKWTMQPGIGLIFAGT